MLAVLIVGFIGISLGIVLYGQVTGRMDTANYIFAQITQIPTRIQQGWIWLQNQGIGLEKVIAMTGGIVTIGTLVVRKLQSNLAQSKAQAQQAQSSLVGMQTNYNNALSQKDQQIANLTTQIQTLKTQDQTSVLSDLQTQNATLTQENQKLISDMNAMERSYQNTIQYLKQQQVTVVK